AEAGVVVDMIVQSVSVNGKYTDMTFTVERDDLKRTLRLLESNQDSIGYQKLIFDSHIAKISIVGIAMKSHAGAAQTMFRVLADHHINIQAISTSEIKVSVLIGEDYSELAMRALHNAFKLDQA
ncbi:MAG: ACT domain-containing protein, partial [Pseudomonadota bacterium]